jgi:hypothetical protein
MNWRFWRKQYRVSLNDYSLKIIQRMINLQNLGDRGLFDYIQAEYNAKRSWSWKTQQNYLVFDNEQDYTLFLLRMA